MSSSISPPPPPPFPYLNVIGSDANHNTKHAHSLDKLKPSIIIVILILTITMLLSISLCLLLRHLNRRCLRHLSTITSTVSTTSDSRRLSTRRVSPEGNTSSLLDSLPLFTFSSVTRRSSTAGDCAVCLCKFEPHDQLRLLPLCCHAFHSQCIDTWLESNQTCPLCRSPINASESDVMKAIHASTGGGGGAADSFRLEIGSISRRQAASDPAEPQQRSYSLGSFDYVVEEESDITMSQTYRRSVSDKEEVGAVGVESAQPASEPSLASEVALGRSWLRDYIDRLSFSRSSRTFSFRSSGRFFTGSSRQSDVAGAEEYDLEVNRVGEEISELFRWFSGV